MTNGDYIRSLSDFALTVRLMAIAFGDKCPDHNHIEKCVESGGSRHNNCFKCWEKWVKEEAK